MIKIRKQRKPTAIPLASMGDIAFLLLIFYMATTMVTDQKPRKIEAPELNAPTVSSPFPLIIYLDEEMASKNSVYFFNRVVPIEQLSSNVENEALSAPGSVRVYLSIERDLPYLHMNNVIQSLKEAGIKQLVIVTRPPEKGQIPAAK